MNKQGRNDIYLWSLETENTMKVASGVEVAPEVEQLGESVVELCGLWCR